MGWVRLRDGVLRAGVMSVVDHSGRWSGLQEDVFGVLVASIGKPVSGPCGGD